MRYKRVKKVEIPIVEYVRLRKAIGSQRKVAKLLGVAHNTISRRELGYLGIDTETMLAMKYIHRKRKTALSELKMNEKLKKLFQEKK